MTEHQLAVALALWKAARARRIPPVWVDRGRLSIATEDGGRAWLSWADAARLVGMEPEASPRRWKIIDYYRKGAA